MVRWNELAMSAPGVEMIIDSVTHWAKEQSGRFPFRLNGSHHIDTMNAVRKAPDEIDPPF